ncbi:MAG: futalosine hydrolase [Saprospiraceae bacterium]
MLILLVAATPFELAPTTQYLQKNFTDQKNGLYVKDKLRVQLLVTGVGLVNTSFYLAKILAKTRPNFVINAGIAGAFTTDFKLGDVVQIVKERFGDLGVEEADGNFVDIHQLKLVKSNEAPYEAGWLNNMAGNDFDFLPKVVGISVNKVHGAAPSIERITRKYAPDLETMESAAVFHACLLEELPFLAIRSISNYVEPRNKDNWDIPLAIEELNKVLVEMLGSFVGATKA